MPKVSSIELMAGLAAALKYGPMTRAQMIERLDMSPTDFTSINRYLDAYQRHGVVQMNGFAEKQVPCGGPRPILFELKK